MIACRQRQEDVFPQRIHSSQSLAVWWKAEEYDSMAVEEMIPSSAGNQFSSEEVLTQLSQAKSYEFPWEKSAVQRKKSHLLILDKSEIEREAL